MMVGGIIMISNLPTKPFVYSTAMMLMVIIYLIGSILIGQVISVLGYRVFLLMTAEGA